ncbi:MAG TPA: nitroreductase family protein [Candidatus Wujingus californicus]|uniref:nitroreductase family protein n=1 Tax=Candidatus Wujingus californicus TaxID=3367618 RepID=UPI001D7985D7|nr:nitroreductase family protein [Planctomycetota bacterium]MDO8131212.1 nitroreductase family protein [Candidatus Brocadiales bacterium]
MNVKEAITKRRSIRKFKPDPVPDELIRQLLESARLAPSGSNTQPWRFIVVKNPETRQRLQKASFNQYHVGQSPAIIACCADIKAFGEFPERIDELIVSGALPAKTREVFVPSLKKEGMSADIKWHLIIAAVGNTDIAIEHMVLQAVELGLGTCWVRWFDDNKVKEILEIPQNIEIIALLPVGYPDEDPPQRPRFKLEKIVYYEKYGSK